MLQVRSTPRYAHTEGHTSLCFSENGNYIITCGSEGDVRIWNGIDDDDPKAVCAGEKAFTVAQKDDKLYVGSDHNYVQIFTFPDVELDGILTRFTAPVNTLSVSKDGSLVAAGSSDMEIRVVEVSTLATKYFTGHKAPILHVTIDPKMEYLGSSSCDGTVRIWKIDDQMVVKEWTGVIKPSNSFHSSETLCQLSWEPITGRLFAIPFTAEIKLIQRCTWNIMMTFSDNQSPQKYSLSAWSSCGRFLAASTTSGEIIVWNTMISRVVSSSSSDVNICSLAWHPQSETKKIAFCDVNGQLVVVDECYPSNKPQMNEKKEEYKSAEISSGDDILQDDFAEEDNDPETISLNKIKSGYNSFIEGDGHSVKGNDDEDVSSMKSYSTRDPVIPLVELQPAFQPTSTPVHLQRRFMVFNDVGYVRQTNIEEENMIDVDFHDASIHHAFRVNNLLNHTMAALNSEALVLACEKSEECSSKLVCKLFNSWDSSKEWNTEMPGNESIEALAVGLKWLAVATNQRFLRLFSLSGVQREILCLRGPILSMNASGDLLFVVYHSAMGLPEEQNLSFAVYEITFDVNVLVAAQPLPLSPKSILKWIGFSDYMNPCLVDSVGNLKLFGNRCGFWKPICNADVHSGRESSNHYFVIGVSEERRNIRGILCKGSYYPSTTPHPFISEIPWQIPVCEPSIDKGILEEQYWRCSIAKECLLKEDKILNKELMTAALKFFALSCKSHHEMRVYELCAIANNSEVTEFALKYASKINSEILVDKLTELQNEQQMRFLEHCSSEYVDRRTEPESVYIRERNEGNERRVNTESCQSQELFLERTSSGENLSTQESVSLIAEIKKKKNVNDQRPILPSRKINPFKKQSQVGASSVTSTAPESEDSSVQSIDNKKDMPLFPEWFKLENENLVSEFPNLNEMELRMLAAKKYRLLKFSSQSSNTDNNTETCYNEDTKFENTSKKRKSDDEPTANANQNNILKKKPLLKLKEFAFKK